MDEKGLAYFFRTSDSEPPRRSWACPDESLLAAYVDGHLDSPARQHAETHVADCSYCLRQVAFLVRTESPQALAEVPHTLLAQARALVASDEATRLRLAWRWGAVAAVAASAAIGAALWLGRPGKLSTPTQTPIPPPAQVVSPLPAIVPPSVTPNLMRSGSRGAVLPQVLSPRDGSVVSGDQLEVRWKEIPKTLFYEIRVVTAEGDLVWEGRTEATKARLPQEVQLQPGQKYFIWVRAHLPEGKTVQSRAVAFHIADNS